MCDNAPSIKDVFLRRTGKQKKDMIRQVFESWDCEMKALSSFCGCL